MELFEHNISAVLSIFGHVINDPSITIMSCTLERLTDARLYEHVYMYILKRLISHVTR